MGVGMSSESADMSTTVSRRTVLGVGAAGAFALLTASGGQVAQAAPDDPLNKQVKRRREAVDAQWTTPNGWPAEKAADKGGSVVTRCILGTSLNVALAAGAPYLVLGHVLRRFASEIAPLTSSDVEGFRTVRRRDRRSPEANHQSGTAVDILAGTYSAPAVDVLTATEILVIEDIVKSCGGSVGWLARSNAAHFFLTHGPSDRRLTKLAATILANQEAPGLHAARHFDGRS
mgnify:CR=1 FL=1